LSGKYFPGAVRSDGEEDPISTSTVTVGNSLGYAVQSIFSIVKYEYQLFSDALSTLWSMITNSNRLQASDKVVQDEISSNHTLSTSDEETISKSTSIWSSLSEQMWNFYATYLLDRYEEYLEPYVDLSISYVHIYSYYTWRFFDDSEELQQNVAWAWDSVHDLSNHLSNSSAVKDIFGEKSSIMVATVFYATVVLVLLYLRKVIFGVCLAIVTIALLPLLIVCYGIAKLVSLVFGRKKVKKAVRPKTTKATPKEAPVDLVNHA